MGERCKVQKQVRNSRVLPPSRPLPRQPGQTAGHTQARPSGTRGHAGKWRPESHRRGCPWLCPPMGEQGGPRAQGPGMPGWVSALQQLEMRVPTSGMYQAGPEMPASQCHCVRLTGGQASTEKGEEECSPEGA